MQSPPLVSSCSVATCCSDTQGSAAQFAQSSVLTKLCRKCPAMGSGKRTQQVLCLKQTNLVTKMLAWKHTTQRLRIRRQTMTIIASVRGIRHQFRYCIATCHAWLPVRSEHLPIQQSQQDPSEAAAQRGPGQMSSFCCCAHHMCFDAHAVTVGCADAGAPGAAAPQSAQLHCMTGLTLPWTGPAGVYWLRCRVSPMRMSSRRAAAYRWPSRQ